MTGRLLGVGVAAFLILLPTLIWADITGNADPVDQDVVYIGETHRQTFLLRWGDFNHSATTGMRGHAGGVTYHARFNGVQDELHVAAFPFNGMEEPALTAFIMYVECRAIWDYVRRWNVLPDCNRE